MSPNKFFSFLNFGIRAKLSIPFLIGLTVIIGVLFFVWQPNQLALKKSQFINSQTKILKSLSPSLIQNILSNDLSDLYSILENSLIIHKEEWRYLQLEDHDKKTLYPIFAEKPDLTNDIVKIQLPLEENDEIFGYLYLYTDWQPEKKQQIKNIDIISIWSIVVFTFIAVLSFVLQTRWIHNPIKALNNITYQFAQGNYETKLSSCSADEIGSLTNSIDHMRKKIQSTLNDLSEKEKLQRSILEIAPDAIITMDETGIIKSFNPGAENIFNYEAQEVIGQNIKMLMPNDIAQSHDQYVSNYNYTGNSNKIGKTREIYGKKKDQSEFPIELAINAKIIEGQYLFTGVLRDISERKRLEKIKGDFVSTVSHELRTPLTAIKGSLSLIRNGLGEHFSAPIDNLLEVSERNVERLHFLIDDILDISKLESGSMTFNLENIDLNSFINSAVEINQHYATKNNTRFCFNQTLNNIQVFADQDRLMQAISNLMSNAAKYSPADQAVEIFTSQVNNDNIKISIKDYGPGIPIEFQDKLFEKFTQADTGDTRQVGGTGLGLNIAKIIVEKMKGNIEFESKPGKGATFHIVLPIYHGQ